MRCSLIFCFAVLLTASCKKNNTPEASVLAAKLEPIANAGTDTTVALPQTNITLDGSKSFDPNNRPLSYRWKKISGPEHIHLGNSFHQNSPKSSVDINCYDAGEYLFEVTVTNDIGLSSNDVVKITVVHSAFSEHRIDQVFDSNTNCKIDGTFPGNRTYDGANFRFNARSNAGSEELYLDQEYEKTATSYFYSAILTVTKDSYGSILFYFPPLRNFFTLPYNSGPATFSDSVTVIYGTGMFANILKNNRLFCTGIVDTAKHTGKITLRGSLYY